MIGVRHAVRLWPWKTAAGWSLGTTAGWLVLSLNGTEAEGILVASPVCIGLMVFFLLGGIVALWAPASGPERARDQDWARRHPWRFAIGPALGVAITVIVARRAVALWDLDETLTGSVVDGLARGLISLVVLVVIAHVTRRSVANPGR